MNQLGRARLERSDAIEHGDAAKMAQAIRGALPASNTPFEG